VAFEKNCWHMTVILNQREVDNLFAYINCAAVLCDLFENV